MTETPDHDSDPQEPDPPRPDDRPEPKPDDEHLDPSNPESAPMAPDKDVE